MNDLNRRQFFQISGITGLSGLAPFIQTGRRSIFRTALIGCGWWGNNILSVALASGRCKLVGLCDVDQNQIATTRQNLASVTSDSPGIYEDYRDLLSREKPEIVIVATPDHWHALNTIAALEKGAHVYVEKPISHTLLEGRAMVQAARDADCTVQVGTHRRASSHNRSAMDFLRSGRVGKIAMVRAFVHYPGGAGERIADTEIPAGLNWDLWCGPAPYRQFNPGIHPRGFRHFLEYANGQLGDWGIHWLDQILWWSEEQYPRSVHSSGGRFIRDDHTNSPDTQVATFQFESFTATWEHRRYAGNDSEKHNIGCYFYGTEGVFHLGWLDGWTFYPTAKGAETAHEEPNLHEPDQQNIPELWQDFLVSIDNRKRPVCDIEIGHRSTSLSLLGMLSLKLGRSVEWDGETETIPGDPEAEQLLKREYRSPWKYPEPNQG